MCAPPTVTPPPPVQLMLASPALTSPALAFPRARVRVQCTCSLLSLQQLSLQQLAKGLVIACLHSNSIRTQATLPPEVGHLALVVCELLREALDRLVALLQLRSNVRRLLKARQRIVDVAFLLVETPEGLEGPSDARVHLLPARSAHVAVLGLLQEAARLGAGEILLTSMDRDGTREGFNLELTRAISDAVSIPVIASGGVGTLDHLVEGVRDGHASAVLAASIFHFGDHTIAEAKAHMANAGIAVRL